MELKETKEIKTKELSLVSLALAELQNFQDDIKLINSEDLGKLKKSIIKYNFQFPFLAYRKNNASFLIDGHQRLKAILSLESEGYKIPEKFPVVFIPFSSTQEAKQAILLFNASYGDFYEKNLRKFVSAVDDKNFLKNIPLPLDKFVAEFKSNFDIKFSKFQNISFSNIPFTEMNKELLEKIQNNPFEKNMMISKEFLFSEEISKEDDYASLTNSLYENVPSVSKIGDVFELNGHFLYHGSSTEESLIASVFSTHSIKILLTDPPYGISYSPHSEKQKNQKIKKTIYYGRGAMLGDTDTSVFKAFFSLLEPLKDELLIILFGGNYFSDVLPPTNSWGIWDKMQSLENRSDAELFWTNSSHNTKIFRHKWNGVSKEVVFD